MAVEFAGGLQVENYEIPYTAQSRPQMLFHQTYATEVLYGGAAGGGKSWAIAGDAIAYAIRNQGSRQLILRRTHNQVWDTFISPIFQLWLDSRIALWNGEYHTYTFKHNGAVIRFGHCQQMEDIHQYDGPPWDRIFIDELTQFLEYQYLHAATKLLRSSGAGRFRPQIKCSSNPWGPGVGWVKKRFKPELDGSQTEWGFPERIFIPARIQDNPGLLANDPLAIERLKSEPDVKKRAAYLEGRWDLAIGVFFEEWDEHLHVIEDFDVPPWWRKWMGVDWGYGSPFCALWLAKDPQTGFYYFYRELYRAKMNDMEQAQEIRALSAGEEYVNRYGDPAMWSKRGQDLIAAGQAPADIYADMEVPLTRGNNTRIHGAGAWRRALAKTQKAVCVSCSVVWAPGAVQCGNCGTAEMPRQAPALRIMRSCANLIRTLPTLPRDEHDPDDVDTDTEDHAYDAGRYVLTAAMVDTVTEPESPAETPTSPRHTKKKVSQRSGWDGMW